MASRGLFEKLKKHARIHSVKLRGRAASADVQATTECPAQQQAVVERGKYPPNLVFNVDENGLFWKHLPSKTFISQNDKRASSGFKAANTVVGRKCIWGYEAKTNACLPFRNISSYEGILQTKFAGNMEIK